MKVVYKKSVKEKIDKVIEESEEQGKEIECIILTNEEYYDFNKELNSPERYLQGTYFLYNGIMIKIEESERKIVSEDGGLTYRVKIGEFNKCWGIGR